VATAANMDLVEQLRCGVRSGVTRLMEMYQGRLISEAVSVFRVPRRDAEEIVDDVLVSVVQKVGTFEFRKGDGDFHVWVMTIFRNRVRDFMRKWTATGALELAFDEANIGEGCQCTDVEREVLAEIVRRYAEETRALDHAGEAQGNGPLAGPLAEIGRALDVLESWERVLLRCRALEIPYEDIAGYTGKNANHLRVYHQRVRKKFLAMLNVPSEESHDRSPCRRDSSGGLP
jgi:RNA polymerase sigma factor (sigma-70 family)